MNATVASVLPSIEAFSESPVVSAPGLVGFDGRPWGGEERVLVDSAHPFPRFEFRGVVFEMDTSTQASGSPVWRRTSNYLTKQEDGDPLDYAWFTPNHLAFVIPAFGGNNLSIGALPHASLDVDGKTWLGDAWWEVQDDFAEDSPSGTYTATPRGILCNNDGLKSERLVSSWPRWAATNSSTIFSIYKPKDQRADALALGSQVYRDDRGAIWRKSIGEEKWLSNSGLTLQLIASDYFFGYATSEPAPGTEWYQTDSPPSITSQCTLTRMRWDVSSPMPVEVEGGETHVEFDRLEPPQTRSAVNVAEVATWLA